MGPAKVPLKSGFSARHTNLPEDQGVWEKCRLTFLSTLDSQAKLDWNAAFLDGSFVPGKKGTRI
jgi:hypothetical protein